MKFKNKMNFLCVKYFSKAQMKMKGTLTGSPLNKQTSVAGEGRQVEQIEFARKAKQHNK